MTDEHITIELRRPATALETISQQVYFGGIGVKMTLDRNKPTQRYISDHLLSGCIYEQESSLALVEYLQPGDTFFDVGANCGWFSALAEARGCHVIAFEPDLDNTAALRRNVSRAVIVEAAVTDFSGKLSLFLNLDNDGGHAVWPCGRHPHNTETAKTNPVRIVDAVRLDQFNYLSPSAIKIDTEGGEMGVLAGASEVLANPALKLVICERNEVGLGVMGHKPEDIEALMRGHGFKVVMPPGKRDAENWHFTRYDIPTP